MNIDATYKLLRDLPNMNAGVLVYWDKKIKGYFSKERDLFGGRIYISEHEMPLFIERKFFEEVESVK